MTVQGMGRAVRLAAATMNDAGNKVAPQPERTEEVAAVEEELGFPAAGDRPAPDAYLRPWVSDWKPATGSTGAGRRMLQPAACRGAEPPLVEFIG